MKELFSYQEIGTLIDQGTSATFTRHVMKNVVIAPPPAGRGGLRGGPGGGNGAVVKIMADQSTPGRYSVLRGKGNYFEISTSLDYGETWSDVVATAPAPGSAGATKQWFEYSRVGALGLMWRATYPDRTYDIWATVSRDGGKTFAQPVRVSHERSPGPDYYRNGGNFGDDIQALSMDRDNMHMVWGDNRAGFQGVWYGRVKLADFK